MTRLFVAATLVLMATQVVAMESISGMTWKNRVIIVFGNADDRRVSRQIETISSNRLELDDRDLIVISVTEVKVEVIFGTVPGLKAAKMRAEAGVKRGSFQVLLVGKDGGVKLRSETVVNNGSLFDVIDRMPMRRAERD